MTVINLLLAAGGLSTRRLVRVREGARTQSASAAAQASRVLSHGVQAVSHARYQHGHTVAAHANMLACRPVQDILLLPTPVCWLAALSSFVEPKVGWNYSRGTYDGGT